MFSNGAFEFSADENVKNVDKNQNKRTKSYSAELKYAQNGFVKKQRNSSKRGKDSIDIHKATVEGLISVVKSVILDDGALVNSYDDEGTSVRKKTLCPRNNGK